QYLDALRLLRQAPAITELAQLDPTGHEHLRVSRLVMGVLGSGLDLSRGPGVIEAAAHKISFGPGHFRPRSEPYVTIRRAGPAPRLSASSSGTSSPGSRSVSAATATLSILRAT